MIAMPWDDSSAPNVMVEVTDVCNLACRFCYAPRGVSFKTLAQIEADIDTGTRLRRLHTVTISGGEPTLHPELDRVVAAIRRRGLVSFLLSNGVLLDRPRLRQLAAAGLHAILFHVEVGQGRPDLERPDDPDATWRRATELARWAVAEGVDASLSTTLGHDGLASVSELVERFLAEDSLSFLFLARGAWPLAPGHSPPPPPWSLAELASLLRQRFGLEPFSHIPDQRGDGTVWLSYFIPILRQGDRLRTFPVRAGRADAALMHVPRLLTGRHVHKTRQNTATTALRTALNGLATRRPWQVMRFLGELRRPGTRLRHKIIVYDHGPTVAADGSVVRCAYCPTAVVRGGRLVACCETETPRPEAHVWTS